MNQPTKKRRRSNNPIAKSLEDRRYQQTIINSKKIYSRKGEKNEIIKAKIEKEPDSKYGFRIVKVLDD